MDIFISLIYATIRQAAPILVTGIGGVFSELTGVVNIGLEGMMLMGAFVAAIVTYYTGDPFIGLAAGILSGGLMGLIHAIISIHYRGNQIVSGVAINLFAAGSTIFLLRVLFNQSGNSPRVEKLPTLFGFSAAIYLIFIIAILSHFFIYRTKTGLRMRAVGEYPLAADTVGVNVFRIRYFGVIVSGLLAGLGGAYLSIGALSLFTKGMSAGRGFIALAAMIFGKWTPFGTIGAALLFGFASALQIVFQQYFKFIPSSFIQMFPYVITLLVLVGVVGKAVAPAADGKPYEKGKD